MESMSAAQAVSAIHAMRELYPKLYDLALAIRAFEGWEAPRGKLPYGPLGPGAPSVRTEGSRSWRNNNPGNLRESIYASDIADGFACFPHYFVGFFALTMDLFAKCTGKTRTGLLPTSTLRDLVYAYAPADENDAEAYTNFLAQRLEVPDDTRIDTFIGGGW